MFEYLSGDLIAHGPDFAILEVAGVGVRVKVPLSTTEELQSRLSVTTAPVRLYTSVRLREEQFHCYGFLTIDERQIFERVCTISGIGPSTALALLSGIPLPEFRTAIHSGQSKPLEKIKGIGKKTAQRLVLELKGVLASDVDDEAASDGGGRLTPVGEDAVAALLALGYHSTEAESSVRRALQASGPAPTLEAVIKQATRYGVKA